MQQQNTQSTFPIHEAYEDYAGRIHNFVIDISKSPFPGYVVNATEGAGESSYEFSAYSTSTPYEALEELRRKIRRGLATRYIRDGQHGLEFTHDMLVGYISCDGLVINGRSVEFEQLAKMLQTYEGFNIEIRLSESGR